MIISSQLSVHLYRQLQDIDNSHLSAHELPGVQGSKASAKLYTDKTPLQN